MSKKAMNLAKSTGLIERLYYKGTTPEDTDTILRFYDAVLAHAKAACVKVCEQTDEDGEGPDQWDWHAKDYASALREALAEQPAQQEQEPVAGCVCRWNSEGDRVVTCERHQGWLEVIAEWADRAREAEKKLKVLNTSPPARKPLTDEQIRDLWDGHVMPVFGKNGINPIVFARAIEAAHGIKENT